LNCLGMNLEILLFTSRGRENDLSHIKKVQIRGHIDEME
jgi:hypothetical protein